MKQSFFIPGPLPGMNMRGVIYGDPVPKPRMTKRDKWAKRPCVLRYFTWCDLARITLLKGKKIRLTGPTALQVTAFFRHTTKRHAVGPHTNKPDGDNILKAVCDALFENDEMIYRKQVQKLWCDGGQPRVEVSWN